MVHGINQTNNQAYVFNNTWNQCGQNIIPTSEVIMRINRVYICKALRGVSST